MAALVRHLEARDYVERVPVVGDRGGDAFAGGAGDDTLVWNNGDGSDRMDGNDGTDRIEVHGANGQGDAFVIAPNGPRAKFDRTNLVPFTLEIGAAEALDVRGARATTRSAWPPGRQRGWRPRARAARAARFTLTAGQRRTLTVQLPNGLRRLVRGDRLTVRGSVTSRDAAGNLAQRSRSVRLTLPRR